MDTSQIRLYRKRFIPEEQTLLKDDKILFMDEDVIITSWTTLKPRSDFASGISAYYRKKGFKISRHYNADGSFSRWYCDIVIESEAENGIIFSDLLIDIIIFPDGTLRVVDLDEAADALEQGLITADMLVKALRSANQLLSYIQQNKFSELTECMAAYINQTR